MSVGQRSLRSSPWQRRPVGCEWTCYGVSLSATGALAVAFDITVTSYVPSLVERGRLIDANATLQASGAAARMVGHGAGGWLCKPSTDKHPVVQPRLSRDSGYGDAGWQKCCSSTCRFVEPSRHLLG
jgi:hypothetical protein